LDAFHEPVDYVEAGLDDYLEIIKRPMDLATLKNAFETDQYPTFQSFEKDLMLIWENCVEYNEAGSKIVKLAMNTE
jgi:hypothetical protein